MGANYRLVFSGRSIYNEIDVEDSDGLVGIGTIAGCKARFSKDIFNQDFLLTVSKTAMGWHLVCEAGVYISRDSERINEIDIQQGDFASVWSGYHNRELFKISCQANYNTSDLFDARIELNGGQQVVIGNTVDANLRLVDLEDGAENFRLENVGGFLQLSVSRTLRGIYVNGNRTIGATKVKNHDFVSCGPYTFYFSGGYLYMTNRERIAMKGCRAEKVVESESALVYPKFNRSTRLKRVLSEEPITILDPPAIPPKPTDSLLMVLLPSVIMLILVVVFRGIMSKSAVC